MTAVAEREMIRTAIATSSAMETVGRKLGSKLITAARKVVAAEQKRIAAELELRAAIRELELLVGSP